MRKLFLTILLFLAVTSYAGQKAITDTGEIVILNSDGTWEYSDNFNKANNIIETNKKKFQKPSNSAFLLKSVINKSAFWINTEKWSFKRGKISEAAEYTFKLKGEDLYGTAITERMVMPIESFVDVALSNAQDEAPDAKIIDQEYRIVNGKKVLYLEITGTMNNIKFTYFGYYYSDVSGVTQFIAYTGNSLINRYKSEINDFLNGLDTQ
jgi:hypothetical protein